jgi:hypothetical protein
LTFLTFLSLKKLWWDVKSISAYLLFFFFSRFVWSPEALKIENSHMKVKNWSCPKYRYGTFSGCKLLADSKNVQILLFGGQLLMLQVEIDQNLAKFYIFWPYLTSSGWNWPSNNKICTFLESGSNLQSEKVPYRFLFFS